MIRWRRWRVVAVFLLAGAVHAGLVIEDDRGVRIQLAAPPQRVVSLAPFITELVYAVGGEEVLVAVSEYSDHPPAARSLRRVSNAFAVDYESILALQPDLVLAWASGNGPRVLDRLSELGLKVFALEPRRLRDLSRSLRVVGQLTGRTAQGDEQALKLENDMGRIRERYAGARPLKVFYQIAHQPIMTLNGEHLVSEVVALCGGRNVFDDLDQLAPTVTLEDVVVRDPDVIIVSSELKNHAEVIERWRTLREFRAARSGQLYSIDSSLMDRQSPRIVEGAERLCAILERARLAAQ